MEEVKCAWKSKYSSDLPTEFISRLECELSKYENDPGAGSIHALSCAVEITKSRIRELNHQLRNEEFFFEVLSAVINDRKHRESGDGKLDVSEMYAKVNKPAKVKSIDSPIQNHSKNMSDKPVTNSNKGQLPGLADGVYEEIEIRNTEIDNPAPNMESRKKARGSVKAKIKMFERSDSSSGEENTNAVARIEGEYARLAKPLVSPKPSPSSQRRKNINEYEEISLPFLPSNKKPEDSSCPKIQSKQTTSTIDTPYADIKSVSDSYIKQERYACLADQPLETNSVNNNHPRKPGPPVPVRRTKGKETNNSDKIVVKPTVAPTLKYSDQEPQLSSSLRHKLISEDAKKSMDTFKPDDPCLKIDESCGGIEGDYCSIRSLNTDKKHVTLVQVTSGNGSEKEINKLGKHNHSFKIISVSRAQREFSRSTEDLSKSETGKVTRSLSKSTDDINQEGHYAELNYSGSNIDPKDEASAEKMKKLFGRKEGSNLKSDDDSAEQVIGKQFKTLSSSSESEEDLGRTVVVDVEDITDEKEIVEDTEAMSRVRDKRRNRVPDYEKWTFQTLLTQTGISVAENENLTDVGSDDETPYDNVNNIVDKTEVVSGQSDDSGVCESTETSSTPDEKEKLYAEVNEVGPGELGPMDAIRPKATESGSSAGSRISTSCKCTYSINKIC